MATATAKRTDPLEAWLERVNAYEAWQVTIKHTGATVTAYHINGQLVLVLRYAAADDGWELFIPPTTENKIDATLDKAAILLGVEGCRGLVEA